MLLGLSPTQLIALASGILLAAGGIVLFTLRPRSGVSTAGALVGTLWGAAIVFASLTARAADGGDARFLLLCSIALYSLTSAPLLYLAAAHLSGRPSAVIGVTVATPGLVACLLLISAPDLFVVEMRETAGGNLRPVEGPLFVFAEVAFTAASFVVALLTALRAWRGATAQITRDQAALVVAALCAYVAYQGPRIALSVDLARGADLANVIRACAVVLCLATTVSVGLTAWRGRRSTFAGLVGVLAAAPLVVGVAEFVVVRTAVETFVTAGIWRLVAGSMLLYGIARYRLFDLDLRLKTAAPPLAYAALAIVASLAFLAWAAPRTTPGFLALGTVGILAVCAPAPRITRALLERSAPHVRAEPAYIYRRKLEVYRAALREADARGAGERTEQAFLSELRRGLGISEAEHRVLLAFLDSEATRGARSIPIQTSAAKFETVRELGRGSFGRAVLARDTVLDRLVVLKQPLLAWLLDAEGRKLFVREARLAARVRHPNVVTIHDVLPDEDPPVIVMEYVEQGSLDDLLAREPRLAPDRALQLTAGILRGLAAIHGASVVHRDLKPANILIDASGAPKLSDFGIAHAPEDGGLVATLAGEAQPGSLAYMSPEQARGEPVDARTDVYAAGAILYRMLTGRHYIEIGRDPLALRRAIQEAAPRLPAPDVPPGIEAVLTRALAKAPDARFADADAMAHALEAAAAPAMRS